MAAVAGAGSKGGFSVRSTDRKEPEKLTEDQIKSARAKWESTDPDIIERLGRTILISGNRPPQSNIVLGLKVRPGSTLKEIHPIFIARIKELERKRDIAQKAYESQQASYDAIEMAASSQREFKSSGIKPVDVFTSIAMRKGGTLDQQNMHALRRAQYQAEIDELTSRFQPALDIFAILQKV